MNIHFQPIVDIESSAVVRAEVFARFDKEVAGIEGTAAYVAAAEAGGLMQGLTGAVLERALAEQSTLSPAATPAISVNVSQVNLDEPDFGARVHAALERKGLAPSALTLELKDGIQAIENGPGFETLRHLVATGVRISVDAFGPSLSMFTHIELERLGIQELKIDADFLASLGPARRVILTSIIDVARGKARDEWASVSRRPMDAVIKNVETAEQLESARQLGCTLAQGFLIAPPMGTAAFAKWLEGRTVVQAERTSESNESSKSNDGNGTPHRLSLFERLLRPGQK